MSDWNSLSMQERAEVMKLALENGIYDLDTIRAGYNEFAKGGSIHIKPSKKGTFTAAASKHGMGVQQFASRVLSHPENYSPAMRKKANFARNAAKWKHGLGGNLFDGTSQPTQKMNIFRRPRGEYFYQASPESEEITVVPRIKVSDDPAYWTYIDANGKLYTPKQTATSPQGEVIQTEAPSTWENIIAASNNNYMDPVLGAPARWKASWDNNTNAIRALWDNPAITGHPLGMAAKAVEHLVGDEGLSKTIRLYQNSDGSDNARWLWQRSLAGDALTSLGLLPIAGQAYKAGKTYLNNNYSGAFGRPTLPREYTNISPIVRTRIGDVEIDNPNLLYHLDRGDGSGAFSNQGAYVKEGFLFPGVSKDATAIPYSWWNKGKPYSTSVKGQPMTRLMTATEDTPGMLHVRSQNYPIGQWDGQRGFVLNSEYVNPQGVDISNSTYLLEPGYGFRKTNTIPTAEWLESQEVPTDITERFFKWIGKPLNSTKRTKLPEEYTRRLKELTYDENLTLREQTKMLQDAGVDVSRLDEGYIFDAFDKRAKMLSENTPARYSIMKPQGGRGYSIEDIVNTENGAKTVGRVDLNLDKDNNMHMAYIENLTRFDTDKVGGVQERGLNSAINAAQSFGGRGVVTGEYYQNAPLQLSVLEKYPGRVRYGKGKYSNIKAVADYRKSKGLPATATGQTRVVYDVDDMKLATPDIITWMEGDTPSYLLQDWSKFTPTKSVLFDPRRITSRGTLPFDWNDPFVFNKGGLLNHKSTIYDKRMV